MLKTENRHSLCTLPCQFIQKPDQWKHIYDHGICISYDRLLQISNQLGEKVIEDYVEHGVVCPPILRKGIFTTSAIDNIDHNPSATTATSSFHGTSISMFQFPTSENIGELRSTLSLDKKNVNKLPDSYTIVTPAYFKAPPDPRIADKHLPLPDTINLKAECDWLFTMVTCVDVDG